MIGIVIEKLKNEPILSATNVMDLKRFIRSRYPGIPAENAAEMLAELIHRFIEGHLSQFSQEHQKRIKSYLLRNALTQPNFKLSAADFLRAVIKARFRNPAYYHQTMQWIARFQSNLLSLDDVMSFSYDFLRLVNGQKQQFSQPSAAAAKPELQETPDESRVILGDKNRTTSEKSLRAWVHSLWYDEKVTPRMIKIAAGIAAVIGFSLATGFFAVSANGNIETGNRDGELRQLQAALEAPGITSRSTKTPLHEEVVAAQKQVELNVVADATVPLIPAYQSKLLVKATAYDLSVESCGKTPDSWGYGKTFTGTRATQGRTIAVDPQVIPLGSRVYLVFPSSYSHMNGVYIAEDTGNRVRGNMIDIFFGEDKPGERLVYNAANRFGIKTVTAYVLN